ncbi:hypothetical protein Taro_030611 [Colocasia esculenta]|uniref:Uncharacterized protein n=1 Tax=Colocasia esculenta TaxID=4460 RepID=A0A843VGR6_COLES|nr:hypothetical protein [Colocasia esculenta]
MVVERQLDLLSVTARLRGYSGLALTGSPVTLVFEVYLKDSPVMMGDKAHRFVFKSHIDCYITRSTSIVFKHRLRTNIDY